MVFSYSYIWFGLMPLFFFIFSGASLYGERRLIAIVHKRLGASFLGRNGWAHLPADLVKFWTKNIRFKRSLWSDSLTGIVGGLFSYLIWSLLGVLFFANDGGKPIIDFWDYQLVFYMAYASLTTMMLCLVAAGTRSKYATIAGGRALVMSILMEVFFVLVFLVFFWHAGGFDADALLNSAGNGPTLFSLPFLSCWLFLYALFEAKRAPFDHTEAEAELVAGHNVDYGGRTLLFFYMGEYLHVFTCVFLITAFVFGAFTISWVPLWPGCEVFCL